MDNRENRTPHMMALDIGQKMKDLIELSELPMEKVLDHLELEEEMLSVIYKNVSISPSQLSKFVDLFEQDFLLMHIDHAAAKLLLQVSLGNFFPHIEQLLKRRKLMEDELARLQALTLAQEKIIDLHEINAKIEWNKYK